MELGTYSINVSSSSVRSAKMIHKLITELGKETKYGYNNMFENAIDNAVDRVGACLANVFGVGPMCQCGHSKTDHDADRVRCNHIFCSCQEFEEAK